MATENVVTSVFENVVGALLTQVGAHLHGRPERIALMRRRGMEVSRFGGALGGHGGCPMSPTTWSETGDGGDDARSGILGCGPEDMERGSAPRGAANSRLI